MRDRPELVIHATKRMIERARSKVIPPMPAGE
jgi:hypothetical protein